MRWRRSCKRLLILLLFICMTIKLHLEFRLLDATLSDNSFSPWWSNETLGHLRGLPKARSTTLGVLRDSDKGVVWIGNTTEKVYGYEKKVLPDASISQDVRKDSGINNALKPIGAVGSMVNTSNKNVSLQHKESKESVIAMKDIKAIQILSKIIPPAQNATLGKQQAEPGQTYSNRKLNSEKSEGKNSRHENQTQAQEQKPQPPVINNPKPQKEEISKFRARGLSRVLQKKSAAVKKGVSHDVDPEEVSLSPEGIEVIKKRLVTLNDEQTIHNEDRYGPFLENTTILLVQVHNRLENLRYLVESMKNTKDINETLVIMSHDYWYPDMNDFVTNITEFRVMQMFFPFSIQLHPLSFPGRDPRDCSWNVNGQYGLQCLNREWPDTYGHYREASFTQIKHHWWWKTHRVFNNLRITQNNYKGSVVFLEEDHYILPDLLHVLGVMQRERLSKCPNCQVLALGNYNKMSPNVYKNNVEKGDWWVTKHNLGFALDVPAWRDLMKCRPQFCDFDDYNWDWTLNNIIQTCFKPRMSMVSLKFSRVIHVGSCGTHVKKKNCDVSKEVQTAKNRIASGKNWLFPKTMIWQNVYRGSGRVKKGNGGWGDFRDRALCQAIWNGTASEQTLERLQFPEFSNS